MTEAKLGGERCLCYPYPALQKTWSAIRTLGLPDAIPEIRKIKQSEAKEYEAGGWEIWVKEQLTFMSVDAVTKAWQRTATYGGSLVENIVQGLCRDILAEAMKRLTKAGYDIAFTVHDEIICEVPLGFGSVQEVEEIMCRQPPWAKDLPIAAEGWRGKRYRKG